MRISVPITVIVVSAALCAASVSFAQSVPPRRQSLACVRPASVYVLPCGASAGEGIRCRLRNAATGRMNETECTAEELAETRIGLVRGCAPDRFGSQRYEVAVGQSAPQNFLVRKNTQCQIPQAPGPVYTAPLPAGWGLPAAQ